MLALAQAAEPKSIAELMPFGTKLMSQNDSPGTKNNHVQYYKYSSSSAKNDILKFYEKILLESGYESVGKEVTDNGSAFFFKKGEESVVIGILARQEGGSNIYLVMISKPIQGNK